MKDPTRPTFLIAAAALPWLLLGAILQARTALPVQQFRDRFMGELGPIELGTVIILLGALGVGVVAWRRQRDRALKLWLAAVVAGCVYFAGEELSWGQHLVGWSTPERLAALNDQGETNLHNISSWLDQKPRLALELWILTGVIHAAWLWWRAGASRALQPRILPGLACLSAGLAVVLARLPERLAGAFPDAFEWAAMPPFDIRLSELQELLIAGHLLIFLAAASVQTRAGGR